MDKARDKLKEQLAAYLGYNMYDQDKVADFILADRKRIVEPLVDYKQKHKNGWGNFDSDEYIDETLRNAGLE